MAALNREHSKYLLLDYTVELFPVVGLATGTILGATDVCSAGPHSTPRSINIFVETLSGGVLTGPDGRSYLHRSTRYTVVRWPHPGCLHSGHLGPRHRNNSFPF